MYVRLEDLVIQEKVHILRIVSEGFVVQPFLSEEEGRVNGDETLAVESKAQAEVEKNVVVQVKEVSSPVLTQSDTTDGTQIFSTGVVDVSESKSDGKEFFFVLYMS